MPDSNRIASIDSLRGLLIVLMLFINDFYPQVAQQIIGPGVTSINSFNAAGWLLPVFLFIVGLTIPLSVNKRTADGEDTKTIARHIVIRTISLLAIGLIMVNSDRVNPEFTGLGKNLWAAGMYIAVFLVWNKYQENDDNFFTIAGLKLAGLAIMVALVFKFKSGEFQNSGSLIIGWWGFLGIIGWGYMLTAFLYLLIKENLLNIIVTALFFLLLAILARLDFFNALDSLKPIFGVITEGSVPLIIMLGIITSLLLKKYSKQEFFGNIKWPPIIQIIGEHSLTAYLLSITLYHLILVTGLPILLYKQSESQLVIAIGSVAWTAIILLLTKFLVKKGIKLKL